MLLLRYPIWVNLSIKRIGLVHKLLLIAGPELHTPTFSAGLIQSNSNCQACRIVILMTPISMTIGWFENQFIFEQYTFISIVNRRQPVHKATISHNRSQKW